MTELFAGCDGLQSFHVLEMTVPDKRTNSNQNNRNITVGKQILENAEQ